MPCYELKERNGITMLDILPVNATGNARGYFTTRKGGISTGVTAQMNCNIYKDFDRENGRENFRLFCAAIGVEPGNLITNRLTFGTNTVRKVTKADRTDIYDKENAAHADGLVTDDRDVVLYLYSADCALIQFVDAKRKVIGACHAGWAGSLNGVIPNTVEAMTQYGCVPSDIVAVICPSIGKCCFEVGNEVAERFSQAGFGNFIYENFDKPHIDLPGVDAAQLKKAGLKNENIYDTGLCTYCSEDLFHSYRRGPVEDGKHLNGMNAMFLHLV